ncbi:unnamed protein product, partial [Rotaria magnacalcarata]
MLDIIGTNEEAISNDVCHQSGSNGAVPCVR